MIKAADARRIALENTDIDLLLEKIEKDIMAASKNGRICTNVRVPEALIDVIRLKLEELGYTAKPGPITDAENKRWLCIHW